MEIINYDMYDTATRHPAGEFCNKMNHNDEWVIMCFNTDFVYYSDGIKYNGKKYQCLINPPEASVIHGPTPESKEGFENSWIIFRNSNIGKIIKRLDLPLNKSFNVTNYNCLIQFLNQLREEEKSPEFYSAEYISGIIMNMLIFIARQRKKSELQKLDVYQAVSRIRREMLENYTFKTQLSDLSEKSGYSVSRFCELYKKFYNTSPIDDLINMRISKARQLLIFTSQSISEIAEKCGFDSIHYFSNTFKKTVGCSPSAYRKNN